MPSGEASVRSLATGGGGRSWQPRGASEAMRRAASEAAAAVSASIEMRSLHDGRGSERSWRRIASETSRERRDERPRVCGSAMREAMSVPSAAATDRSGSSGR